MKKKYVTPLSLQIMVSVENMVMAASPQRVKNPDHIGEREVDLIEDDYELGWGEEDLVPEWEGV